MSARGRRKLVIGFGVAGDVDVTGGVDGERRALVGLVATDEARVDQRVSGGVDSAVTLHLLQKAGHSVRAVFMKNWEDSHNQHCTSDADMASAQAVCDRLNLPLEVVNFADAYWDNVFSYFLDALNAGYTPNPDVLCNSEIKFKLSRHRRSSINFWFEPI